MRLKKQMQFIYGRLLCAGLVLIAAFLFSAAFVSARCVDIVEDPLLSFTFIRHTVTGIRTPLPVEPDVPGFKGPGFIAVGDLDQDGVLDIVCSSLMGQSLNFMLQDGAIAVFTRDGPSLDAWTQTIINETFAFPNDMVLRDMDDDGDLDIMVLDNYLGAWAACGVAGIYYLENGGGEIADPANWEKRTIVQGEIDGICPCTSEACADGIECYHRAEFYDMDGDGLEDFVTTKAHMWNWQKRSDRQYRWVEWFRRETDMAAFPSGFSGPYEIGDGGGFFASLFDVDKDGDLDVVAPQFLIQSSGGLVVKGGPDGSNPWGDTLAWFENPGAQAGLSVLTQPWNRYTIENWYASSNPVGKGFDVFYADIDNDGDDEILLTNHNHQEYKDGNRIWPSGVFYFDVPDDPKVTANWNPVTIDSGDPNLDPDDEEAVAADPFAVDRPGGPYSQGSPAAVKADDITGDGFPELVLAGDGKGAVYYYESQGFSDECLVFKRAALYRDPACMPGEPEIVDIDGDGDLDVVAVIYDTSVNKDSSSGSIFVYENTASPLCPLSVALEGRQGPVDTMRAFRDKVLAPTMGGRSLTALYYTYAPEVTALLLQHPRLRVRATRVLDTLMPAIQKAGRGEYGTLRSADLQEVVTLIDELAQHAGPTLQKELLRLRTLAGDAQQVQQYGFTIIR